MIRQTFVRRMAFGLALAGLLHILTLPPALRAQSKDQAPANLQPKANPDPTPQPAPEIRATLYKIKGDWSKAADAKAIDAELRDALKDASVPTELFARLPTSAAQILFSQNQMELYSTESYQRFLAWLKSKDLLGESVAFEPNQAPNLTADSQSMASAMLKMLASSERSGSGAAASRYGVLLTKDVNLSDVSDVSLPSAPPFVKRKPQIRWQIWIEQVTGDNQAGSIESVTFSRQVVIADQARGSDEVTQRQTLDQYRRQFELPEGFVGIINANSSESGFSSRRPGEVDSIIVIQRSPFTPAPDAVKPQFLLPEKVVVLTDRVRPYGSSMMAGGMMPPGAMGSMAGPPPKRGGANAWGAAAPRSTPAPNPPKPSDVAPTDKLLIIHLKHIEANNANSMIKLLFPNSALNIAADARVNQLIIRGNNGDLDEITALLEQLDRPQAGNPEPKSPPIASNPPPTPPRAGAMGRPSAPTPQRAQDYHSLEQQSLELAAAIREAHSALTPDDPQRKQLEVRLRESVNSAFVARQQMLHKEVSELQERAQRLQQTIELRSRIQDKIVERRVTDLLNPNLQWDVTRVQTQHVPQTAAPIGKPTSPTPVTISGPPHLETTPEVSAPPKKAADVAEMKEPYPKSAVVWIELTFSKPGPMGKDVISAQYVNGTVVSDDGLVAFAIAPGDREEDILRTAGRATLFVGSSYNGIELTTGRIVAYDSRTGLGLFRCANVPSAFLKPDDNQPALHKQLTIYGKYKKDEFVQEKQLSITELDTAAATTGFQVDYDAEESLLGAALVDSAFRLQGILSHRTAPPPTAGVAPQDPFSGAQPEPNSRATCRAISGQDILAIIARYRTTQNQNAASLRVPQHGPLPIGLDFEFPTRKPTATPSLDANLIGVWELTLPDGKPAPNGLRLVFLENQLAVFINGQRTSSWSASTDTAVTPHRIKLLVHEGASSLYGIFEIKEDGLRLNVASTPDLNLTTFGTERPEFRRVSRDVPEDLQQSMRQIPPIRHPMGPGTAESSLEQLEFQMILFDMEREAASKLFTGKSIPIVADGQPKRGVLFNVPEGFQAKLRQLVDEGKLNMLSRPQIRTLLGQPATVEIGQTTGKSAGEQPGMKLEIVPSRRIDSSLQLDLSVVLSGPGLTASPANPGDIILPGSNSRSMRSLLAVPADGQILLNLPSTDHQAARMTFLYITKEMIAPQSSTGF